MPVPATTGKLCTTIEEMKIGDYIYGFYDASVPQWGIGEQKGIEVPVNGIPASAFESFWFYYIKADKGLLIADRVVQVNISWGALNLSDRIIAGRSEMFAGVSGIFRSLTGGVAYADANGNISLTDKGFGGWPTNNEWDKHIVNFPSHNIQVGRTISDIWNFESINTWMQETPVNGLKRSYDSVVGANTFRIVRSYQLHFVPSANSYLSTGFRPVFEYKEV